MKREIVKFLPNRPVEVALQYPTGRMVSGNFGDQVMFSLSENRVMYLALGPAGKISELGPNVGETFFVCKRWTGRKEDQVEWDCYLSPETERLRAQQLIPLEPPEVTVSDLEQKLKDLAEANRISAAAPPPPAVGPARGTGTYGPVAVPAAVRTMPTKRQYADAFALFLVDAGRATRAAALALAGEGGSPMFDNRDIAAIATTMFIQASKDGFLTWNGGAQ